MGLVKYMVNNNCQ